MSSCAVARAPCARAACMRSSIPSRKNTPSGIPSRTLFFGSPKCAAQGIGRLWKTTIEQQPRFIFLFLEIFFFFFVLSITCLATRISCVGTGDFCEPRNSAVGRKAVLFAFAPFILRERFGVSRDGALNADGRESSSFWTLVESAIPRSGSESSGSYRGGSDGTQTRIERSSSTRRGSSDTGG